MKKYGIIGMALLTVVLLAGFVNSPGSQDKTKDKKATVTEQKTEKHDHEEGSAACQEKHAKGECKGHEPGQSHHMEKGDNPGHDHKEGSVDCKEKHAKGECKGHEPGQPHHTEKSDNPGHSQKEGSAACMEKHDKSECKGHKPGQPHNEKHDKPNQ